MFTINRLDLDYLLRQVEIGTDYSQLQNALDPSGLREVSGENNNIVAYDTDTGTPGPFSGQGAADEAFVRILNSTYTGQAEAYGVDANGNGTGAVGANVSDASPRIISRLISNQYETNPDGSPVDADGDPSNGIQFVAEFAPNAGPLGAGSFNSWFTAFGQFFDHGLDFLGKGANGTISIPLTESDPLWIDPASSAFIPGVSNVMRISRGNLANPAEDFDPANPGQLLPGITPVYNNNTGLTIDQSQTYGSHASVNAFLREYDADGNATGRLVTGNTAVLDDNDTANDGQATGLATWADVKANALRVGITLTDQDVFDAPELMTNAQGEIIRDVNGNAQLTGGLTGQAFLLDINPAANPNFHFDIDPSAPPGPPVEMTYAGGLDYDSELLDAHYIAGDGRINENIALTAVHHVFHEEHNFQVENIKQNILDDAAASGNTDNLANWLVDGADPNVAPELLEWNAEYIFQAARIITETEYNHVAVGFMERLAPDLAEFVSYSSDVNPAISLEFSQAVFRLGHSMLRETFELRDANGNVTDEIPLLDAFLNPTLFADTDISELVTGLVGQIGNEVDELITPALQQTLLGQPLDLAAINIARGRETGLPTFNELRDQLSQGLEQNTSNINGGALTPYDSWADYGAHLRHPEQLVNFIAAYGRDVDDDWGLQAARATGDTDIMRAAAQAIIDAAADDLDPNHALAVQFISGGYTPTDNPDIPGFDELGDLEFAEGDQGIWDVDLWIGGLAEAPTIEGILGTTFSYIFLDQAQRLVDGDRFYYLFRLPPGTSLGDEIIRTTFTELVQRNTDTEFLSGDIFTASDATFILDQNKSNFFDASQQTIDLFDLDAADGSKAPGRASDGHIVIAGGAGNDVIYAGNGDDTVWGGDGDDIIRGGAGNDAIFGGAGNDFISDEENDDFIDGGDGDDIIFAGKGAIDTVFGGNGNDEIHGGDGIDELFGGEGDDEIFGDGDTDVLLGENGNDYLEGGDSVDEMWGGNGNDILVGGVGDDHLNGDGGNDLLFGGLGAAANDGDRLLGDAILNQGAPVGEGGFQVEGRGFDVASYENVGIAITADLQTSNQNGTASTLIDSYAFIDGIVGTRFDDDLTGAGADTITSNGFDNLLVGGGGDDVLTGLGGDDWIIGDWAVVNNDLQVVDGVDQQAFFDAQFEDKHGLNRTDTGDGVGLAWMGHVLGNNGPEGDNDVAVFSGDFDDYIINDLGNGITQVIDTRGIDSNVEGVIVPPVPDEAEAEGALVPAPLFTTGGDRLRGIEWMQFNDVRRRVNNSPPMLGAAAIVLAALIQDTQRDLTAAELLGMGASEITDPDGDLLTVQNVQVDTGTVTDNGNGTWTFIPEPGDTSEVVFSYEVTDGTEAIAVQANLDLLPDGPDVVVVPPGGNGDDVITGGTENDIIEGGNGNDQIFGLGGNDILFGDEGDDQIFGGEGNDVVFGGQGEDQIFGDIGNDMLFGGEGNDVIFGGEGNDIIQGGEGNDLLLGQAGNDIIDGGKDNDTIHGGLGRDMLTGGQDDDTFVFNTAAEAGNGVLADMITDFQVGDKIDLSSIDANLGLGGNQGFALLNQATFTDAGQLIFRHDGGNTILEGDVDGDNTADFRIDLVGIHNLTVSDFSGVA